MKGELDQFEHYLTDVLDRYPECKTKEAMAYALFGSGKRVRPRLLFAALQDYGLDPTIGFPAAAAIEMMHTYSLIHDDLPAMDDDDLRRGRPSCHRVFGEAVAILAGDALQCAAFEVLLESQSENVVDMARLLAQKSGASGMVYGQDQDIHADDSHKEIQQLIDIETYKTGCLLQLPLMMAACLANRKQDLPVLEQIGLLMGIQFQIQDDILDVTTDEAQLGKSNSDTRNGKQTAVTVLGLSQAQDCVKQYDEQIHSLFTQLSNSSLALERMANELSSRTH